MNLIRLSSASSDVGKNDVMTPPTQHLALQMSPILHATAVADRGAAQDTVLSIPMSGGALRTPVLRACPTRLSLVSKGGR